MFSMIAGLLLTAFSTSLHSSVSVGSFGYHCKIIRSLLYFTGWGLGDPHINTVDGANYTFNGWGEYILFTAGNFSLQGRATPVNRTVSGSATQWSAFAFGSREDVVVEVCSSCTQYRWQIKD